LDGWGFLGRWSGAWLRLDSGRKLSGHHGLRLDSYFRGCRLGLALALFVELAVVGVDRLLDFLHHIGANAWDLLELLGRHAAQLLDGADASLEEGLEQLVGQAVIDEHGNRRAGRHQRGHLRFHFQPLFLFALDVDSPSEKLGREAHVLPLLTDGEGKLRIVHDHFHVLSHGIEDGDPAHLGRAEGMGGEHHRVVGIFDDVDLLAAQLADDGLHAHALHAHAGAYAIYVAVAALDGDLSALAGFARASLDGHRAVVDLGDFLLEEAHHQLRRGARHHHPGTFAGLVHQPNHAADAVAHAVAFQARLLLLGQLGLGLAEVQNVVRPLDALDGAVHEFARAPGVFLVHGFALGFADLLENDLLGGLRRNTAQRFGAFLDADFGTDFGLGLDAPRLGQRHFVYRVFDRLHRLLDRVELDGAGFRIQLGDVVFGGAVVFPGGDQHGVPDGVQDDLRIDALFLAQYLDGLKDRFQSALVVPIRFLAVVLSGGLTTQTSDWLSGWRRAETVSSSPPRFRARWRLH